MSGTLLTAYQGSILGPIAKVLGILLNAIYETVGLHSVVFSILLITVLIYMCLLPLTIKQQKFSKLQQAMQPEIKKIQDKYKGKKDNASLQAQNQETQLVYQKYGVSPTGSCVQLLIQMPIFFALYRVFYNIPAYIPRMKEGFNAVVSEVISADKYQNVLQKLMETYSLSTQGGLNKGNVVDKLGQLNGSSLSDAVIDILYKLPTQGWEAINSNDYFNGALTPDTVTAVVNHLHKTNYFLGLNISETPWLIIKTSWANHTYLYLLLALLIPVLSYLSQLASVKLMPTASNGNDQMAQQMKTMNYMMPLMSFVICFTVPVGLGFYWIFSAVVRVIQQFFINRHIKNLDLDDLIKANEEKAKKKREKMGIAENQIRDAAAIRTQSLSSKANIGNSASVQDELNAASEIKANAKPGSMAAKANLVKDFNEKNSRK